MENLNSVDLKVRERELAQSFSDRFRRLWLAHTRLGNVCITAFPLNQNGSYQMYFAEKVQDWSLESLRNIVLSQIKE